MPRLVVTIVGDASSLERTYAKANASSKQFTRDMEKTHARVTGVVTGLGKSLAFASGGFLAFSGVSAFLTKSISVARDAAVSQRQLAAQMEASGESFAANQARIEQAGLALSKFGFTSEDSAHALTVLDRATGNINKSIWLQGLAVDLARAKNIDLAAAALTVAKVFGGQETALRRAVPGLEKHAHGLELIREAQAKLAGQAAASTTVAERFDATLHETERIVGTALLPTLNKYLASLAKWLAKNNENGNIQRDIQKTLKATNAVVAASVTVYDALAGAIGGVIGALRELDRASKFLVVTGPRAIFNAATFGAFAGAGPEAAPRLSQGSRNAEDAAKAAAGLARAQAARDVTATAVAAAARPGAPVTLRNTWFDNMIARQLDRVQDLSLRRQLGRLKEIAGEISARIDVTKDVTRRLNLQDKLVAVMRQERDVTKQMAAAQQQAADAIKQQNALLKQRADQIKTAALDQLQRQQTRILNQRALQDALEQLRVARQIGGPQGIKQALRGVEDARFAIAQARLETLPATLRPGAQGGQTFSLGNQIVINIHGNENPEQVARKVVAIIERRSRYSSVQSRGPGAGSYAGQH